MSTLFVRRIGYKKLAQDALGVYAENVFNRMSTMPEYQPFAADVTTLGQQLEQYKAALAEAVHGGLDRIAIKNERLKALLTILDRIADQLNSSYTGNDTWVINAGMELQRESSTTNVPLNAPFELRAVSNGAKGEVALTFRVADRSRVRNHAIEYSLDAGASWQNSTYTTASRIRLKGFPSRQEMRFRVRSLGSGERKSPWSKEVEVFVL